MAGSIAGGKKAAQTNMSKFGSDFYKRIGALGGKKSKTGGFASSHNLAVVAGRKGGQISKRGWKYDKSTGRYHKAGIIQKKEIEPFFLEQNLDEPLIPERKSWRRLFR